MDPMERSRKIREEADVVMRAVGLHDALAPCGQISLTGSYYLDVMIYPDIDLFVPKVPVAQLFQAGGQIASSELVYEVIYQRSRVPALPGGLYMKPRIRYGNWERPWKIDIWSVDQALIDKNMAVLRRFGERMTQEIREQIIRFKYAILTDRHRTPMYSGYWIYKAFIDEGLSEHGEVVRYLIDHGIEMG